MLGAPTRSHHQPDLSTVRGLGRGSVFRALSYATVLTLPLVSVPLLPETAATAVTPISIVFAALLLASRFVGAVRYARVPRWLLLGALLTTTAVIMSYLPVVFDPAALGVDGHRLLSRSIRAIVTLGAAGIYVGAFFVMLRSRHIGPERFTRIVVVAGCIHAVVALLAIATALGVPVLNDVYRAMREVLTTSGASPIGGLRRVAALGFEPSFAGFEYAGWWVPISLALAFNPRTRWSGVGLTGVFTTAALATVSLTAALGLIVVAGTAALVYVATVRGAVARALFVCAAIAALALAPTVPPVASVLERVARQVPALVSSELLERGPRDPSLAVRGALLHTALNVSVAYPLTGAGFGLAGYRFPEYRPAWTFVNPYMSEFVRYLEHPDGRVFPTAKNLYVRASSEAGLLFLAVLIGLVTVGMWQGVVLARRSAPGDQRRWVGLAATFGIAGSAAAYLSLDSFAIPYLWAWLGIVAGARAP